MEERTYVIDRCKLRIVLDGDSWRKEAEVVLPTGKKVRVIMYG